MAFLIDEWVQPHICNYCKKEFQMTVLDYRTMIRRLGQVYCSEECEKMGETNK